MPTLVAAIALGVADGLLGGSRDADLVRGFGQPGLAAGGGALVDDALGRGLVQLASGLERLSLCGLGVALGDGGRAFLVEVFSEVRTALFRSAAFAF